MPLDMEKALPDGTGLVDEVGREAGLILAAVGETDDDMTGSARRARRLFGMLVMSVGLLT